MSFISNVPEIQKSAQSTRLLASLQMGGYARKNPDHSHTIDWSGLRAADKSQLLSLRNLGLKSYQLLQEWLAIIETNHPALLTSPKPNNAYLTMPTIHILGEENLVAVQFNSPQPRSETYSRSNLSDTLKGCTDFIDTLPHGMDDCRHLDVQFGQADGAVQITLYCLRKALKSIPGIGLERES